VNEGDMATWQWAVCLLCAVAAVLGLTLFAKAHTRLIAVDQEAFTIQRGKNVRRIAWASVRGAAMRLGDGLKFRIGESSVAFDELVIVQPQGHELFSRFEREVERRFSIAAQDQTVD